MTRDEILKILKNSKYNAAPGPTTSSVIVYTTEKDRKNFLKKELSSFFASFRPRYQENSPVKSSSGCLVVDRIIIVAKPSASATTTRNIAELDARVFTTLGKKIKYRYREDTFDAISFSSADILKKSILLGIKKESLLGSDLAEMMEEFFEKKSFTWPKNISLQIKNKFGVYIGEVLIGYCILKGWRDSISPYPFNGTVKQVIIPTDPAFTGVDSFIEMQDKTVYPVSSKYGEGAKASIFANLLPMGVENLNRLTASKFKTLCNIAVQPGKKPTDARAIVYEYGIRKILNLSTQEFPSPGLLYEDIKANKLSTNSKKAIEKLQMLAKTPNKLGGVTLPTKITGQFGQSNNWVSSYFNYVIAAHLQTDRESIQQMKKILCAKNYWQSNLKDSEWLRGKLQFNIINSGDAGLTIDGAKSPATDITSKQGWLNYKLG